jgi:hypothetical protein
VPTLETSTLQTAAKHERTPWLGLLFTAMCFVLTLIDEMEIRSGDIVYSKMRDRGLYVCRSDEDIGRLIGMFNKKDHTAVTDMLQGPCKLVWHTGRMQIDTVLNSVPCVGRNNQVDCLWTNPGWLTKEPVATEDYYLSERLPE